MQDEVIQDIVAFALAASARLDRPAALGPIHLMKLLYLADWAYAKKHHGETYSGIPWMFHHFGPYCPAIEEKLDRMTFKIGAEDKSYEYLPQGKTAKRWSVESDEQEFEEIERKLPFEIARIVKYTIETHGNDTYPLLHEVYRTYPMRRTAPGELIDFKSAVIELLGDAPENEGKSELDEPTTIKTASIDKNLSKTQQKKQQALIDAKKAPIREALERSKASKKFIRVEPVYDEVYEQGVAWLDSQNGQIQEQEFEIDFTIDQSVWKSDTRKTSI